MSQDVIERYVVTIRYTATGLRAPSVLIGELTQAGFSPTLTDDDGVVHELGPHNFGLITPLSAEEVKEMTRGLANSALNEDPEIEVANFNDWLAELNQP
ncbi:hypothetical protein TUM12370_22290 [Salmonella enterica subsp. enterica serovar Choleraesuis]|nr:hypothetical protein TUM12370_22290 [Salmonella enterica subsp. enterica serovar Choleraesuis]